MSTLRELIKKELWSARQHARVGATSEAEHHIRIAVRLCDGAPRGSFPRAVRSAITWAGRAVMKSDADLALLALEGAVKLLDDGTIADEG